LAWATVAAAFTTSAITAWATVATAFTASTTAAFTTGTTIAALALFAGRACVFQLFTGFLINDAHRQANLAAWVDFKNLDLNVHAFADDVRNLLNALIAHFADVDETVLATHEVYECAEINQIDDLAVINLANFCFFNDARNPLTSGFDLRNVGR
jgi:hypothetical protein